MDKFALLFRQADFDPKVLSASELASLSQRWHDWVGGIAAQGKLVNTGTRLASEGKVLRADGLITDGPFVEVKERLGSFLIVQAGNLADATTLAHGCPALEVGGSVEIRPVLA